MSREFETLIVLEKSKVIAVGIDRSDANKLWSSTTNAGRLLNTLTLVFIVASVFIFVKIGWVEGVISLIFIGLYAIIIQNIASMHVRLRLMKEESLFVAAYDHRSATLKNNKSSEIIHSPTDWRRWINSTGDQDNHAKLFN